MQFNCCKTDESYRFNISISQRCYDHKPTKADHEMMSFCVATSISVDELLELIQQGHAICHVFAGNRRLKGNFLYTYSVFVDVDNSDICMSEFIVHCSIKPTLAYTTASNGKQGKGYRYRLIYVFNGRISTEALYKSLYFYIAEQNNLENTKDKCGSICNQLMNGNPYSNIETYCSYLIYDLNSEIFSECSLEYTNSLSPHYYSKEHFENKKQQKNSKSKIRIEDTPGGADMIDLLMHDTNDFLAYYKGRVEEIRETRIDYNEDGYGLYPDDYFCLYYRFDWKKKKICRFKDHEKRRNRLYIDACIMRRIKPDASFMEFLYNLVLRRQRYYDNSDGVLTNRFLIEKVNQVLSMDIFDLY